MAQGGSEPSVAFKEAATSFLSKIEKTVLMTKQKAQSALGRVGGQKERPQDAELSSPAKEAVENFEKQMQRASLGEARGSSVSDASAVPPEALELQAAAARVSQCLHDAEARAASAEEQNGILYEELKASQLLVTRVSDQLHVVVEQFESNAARCRQLQEDFGGEPKPGEEQKTLSALLEMLEQLEAELTSTTEESMITKESPDDGEKLVVVEEEITSSVEALPAMEATQPTEATPATDATPDTDATPSTEATPAGEDAPPPEAKQHAEAASTDAA